MTARELERNYRLVELRIANACERAGRTRDSVRLVAATKNQPVELLADLREIGCTLFGENKVQELISKQALLGGHRSSSAQVSSDAQVSGDAQGSGDEIEWHFIGHLQSNKAKLVAPFIRMVHSIDSFTTARALDVQAKANGRTIEILIEVNISREDSKNGVESGDAGLLAEQIVAECSSLEIRGLMGMASYESDVERTRRPFGDLANLRANIAERHPELKAFTELSMGMSNDFEVAIEEGATIVRIGSALFGERIY